MTFPSVVSESSSNESTGTQDHDVSYPPTINAGNTLLLSMVINGANSNQNLSVSNGFSIMRAINQGSVRHELWRKKAVGTESGTFTVHSQTAEPTAHKMYAVHAADPDTTPPEATSSFTVVTTVVTPSLTPTFGAQDTMWIWLLGTQAETNTTYPSGYSNTGTQQGTGTGVPSIHWARRNLNASSEQPGSVNLSGGDQVAVAVVAFASPPAALGGSRTLSRLRNVPGARFY